MEGGASHAKEDAELQIVRQYLMRDLFIFRRLSHCQPGCLREDASALTFQLAQPADNVSSLNLAYYGLTDLGSEPDSRHKHHYQEQIV